MGESITYAELWFSNAPPEQSVTCRAQGTAPPAPDEAKDIYETLQLGPVTEGPVGPGTQRCRGECKGILPCPAQGSPTGMERAPRGARGVAACGCWGWSHGPLFLAEHRWSARPLLLVLLAACLALLATTIALGVCYWQQGQQLRQVREEMVKCQKDAQVFQKHLNTLARALAHVQACQVTDCCPETWVLQCGKCLFLSKEKKTWWESLAACAGESSRLLVFQDWDHMAMLTFPAHKDAPHWIGLRFRRDSKSHTQQWHWEDGTLYNSSGIETPRGRFGTIKGSRIETKGRLTDKHYWVCEKLSAAPTKPTPGHECRDASVRTLQGPVPARSLPAPRAQHSPNHPADRP
ncbi:LOW QUALITY PROTEIN: CD209 antigen-like protein E [Alligator sinensis]|uniref:LOW QUALITY PROTEIN: CD209 antigen-like protein E n=1 Tax=Alligator sinensis TaxID=38654 RepID=A0A3Q0HL85_ALLSI|nr:LOW QUALITY PROTEIN: CD209 antigen-like protein E [Alligator sinensis]